MITFMKKKKRSSVFYCFAACDLIFLSPQRSYRPVPGGRLDDRNSINVFNELIFRFPGEKLNSQVSKKPSASSSYSSELCSAADQLAQETRLSKTEVDCWFSERRGLRDNMEKALLTMASKNTEERVERPGALLNGASHREQDRKTLHSPPHPPVLSSSSSSSSPPVLAASSPHPPTLSSSASPPILTSSSSSSSSPHPPILSASTSPVPITSRSLALLREVRGADNIMSTQTLIRCQQI